MWVCVDGNFGVEVVLGSVVVSSGWSEIQRWFDRGMEGRDAGMFGWIWGRKWE